MNRQAPAMPQLHPADMAIVACYLLATTLLGASFTRRQRDLNTYFVGERSIGWLLILVSIVATETSTVTFLSVPGLAFKPAGGNLAFLQLAIGFIIGRCVIAWLLLPQYLRGELFSAYQLLRQRFDTSVQRLASAIFLFTRIVADGLRLYLAALLLQQFTGWDMTLSILVIGGATMVYIYLGGMQAVIWTDLVQFAIYITGALIAAGCIIAHTHGSWAGFWAAGNAAQKFTWLNFHFDSTQPYTFWAGLVGGAFLTMASHGADQMMVQRYLCSRSLAGARLALVGSGFVVLAQFLLFLLIGAGLFVLWQQGTLPLAKDTPYDTVFGHFIVGYLPTGIVGVLVAAVLAASMSSLASSLSSASSAFVSDFYRPLRPGRTDGHYLSVARWMTSLWGLSRIAVALIGVSLLRDRSVVNEVLGIAGLTTGVLLGLFLLGSLRRPVASRAALVGVALGFSVVLLVSQRTALAWPWYAPIGTLATVGVALIVNVLGWAHGPLTDGGSQPGLDEPGRADAVAAGPIDE